jgi:hypothetical protein
MKGPRLLPFGPVAWPSVALWNRNSAAGFLPRQETKATVFDQPNKRTEKPWMALSEEARAVYYALEYGLGADRLTSQSKLATAARRCGNLLRGLPGVVRRLWVCSRTGTLRHR